MSLLGKLGDTSLLLEQWLRAPKCIGAVAPSSKRLALAMARWVTPPPNGWVLELGPGTGAVTEALFECGLPQERLLAIEATPALADLLRRRFPATHVITGDARRLLELLQPHTAAGRQFVAVVSSLPLRQFTEADRVSISHQIHTVLPPGGRWIQYTYHIGNGQPPGSAPFRVVHSTVVWLNVPPARVSVYEKWQRPAHASRTQQDHCGAVG